MYKAGDGNSVDRPVQSPFRQFVFYKGASNSYINYTYSADLTIGGAKIGQFKCKKDRTGSRYGLVLLHLAAILQQEIGEHRNA